MATPGLRITAAMAARMRFGDVMRAPAGHVRPIEWNLCDLTLDANFSNHRTGAEAFAIGVEHPPEFCNGGSLAFSGIPTCLHYFFISSATPCWAPTALRLVPI